MNIFYLDSDPKLAAMSHCDIHVNKMLLESAQIICTVAAHYDIAAPYKPTHASHPCVLWAAANSNNLRWLLDLAYWLNAEWRYRWERSIYHLSAEAINSMDITTLLCALPDSSFREPPQAMPAEFQRPDSVAAYRAYYRWGKQHLHSWTKRERPDWL